MECVVEGTELIIVGDAPNKGEEYEQALEMMPYAHVMNINNAGREQDIIPQLVATQHGAYQNFIGTHRMPLKYIPEDAFVMCSPCNGDQHHRIDAVYGGTPMWGTSALFGVLCACYHGYDRMVIAGCDMRGGYGSESKLDSWRAWKPYIKPRIVAVISGKLKELFEEA